MKNKTMHFVRLALKATILVFCTLLFTGCKGWEIWDVLFQRENLGGWQRSDAAYTVAIPGNRHLWVFGDTFFKCGTSTSCPFPMQGNSIAVHTGNPNNDPPSPADMRFYARNKISFNPANITSGTISYANTIAWAPTSSELQFMTEDAQRWMWPGDGLMTGTTLSLFFNELTGTWANSTTWQMASTQLVTIGNPQEEPESWMYNVSSLNFGNLNVVKWGSAVLIDPAFPDSVFVFGVLNSNAVIALAPKTSLADPSTWFFHDSASWRSLSQATPATLTVVAANVPPEFTVDRIVIDGVKRYVMVHGDLAFNGKAIIRLSTSLLNWPAWDAPSGIVRNLNLLDPDIINETCVFGATSVQGDCVWAVKAHDELSQPDNLLISYYVQASGLAAGEHSGLRFLNFPLRQIAPWCTANCWD